MIRHAEGEKTFVKTSFLENNKALQVKGQGH